MNSTNQNPQNTYSISTFKMVSNKETCREKQRGGNAAVKKGCRILATTFLSLIPALSFLLLARLFATRYFLSITNDQPYKISFLNSLFFHSKATLILSVLVVDVAFAALVQGLTGNKAVFVINKRRRLYVDWVLLFLIQVCLNLGIHGTINDEINNNAVGNLVVPRRLAFAVGLHEIVIFWRRNVVKPVVDETIFGFSDKGSSWVEKVVLAVLFGNLWWQWLIDEAEALVVLPLIRVELMMSVEVADVVGWLLYYLTVAIGGVRVIKGFLWAVIRIFKV